MKTRLLDNLHLPFWLIKDACWALVWKPLGVAMIIPTVLLSLYISWKAQKNSADFLPSLTVTFWISANSVWMCDEFFQLHILWISLILFALGMACILSWLYFYFPALWKEGK